MAATAIATSYAGPLQLGGANGLQTSQVAGSITTSNTTLQPYSASVLQGTGSSAGNSLTSGSLCSGFAATSSANCTANSGTSQSSIPYTSSASITPEYAAGAHGVTFALIDQASAQTASVWDTSGAANSTSTITIPMGIFGVSKIYTMMNDNFGVPGGSDVTVQFNFSTGSELFTLVDGTVIRDSWDCTAGTNFGGGCQNYQSGGSDPLDTVNSYNEAGTIYGGSGPSVSAFNVLTASYLNTSAGLALYKNTSGNIFLDAQNFNFGTLYSNATLINMVITDSTTAASQSRLELSAIDYVSTGSPTAPAPEPTTVLLLLTGLGSIALVHRKRRA